MTKEVLNPEPFTPQDPVFPSNKCDKKDSLPASDLGNSGFRVVGGSGHTDHAPPSAN